MLTKRQLEVMKNYAEGKETEEVAEALFISLATVKTHTRDVYERLQAKNRTHAVAILMRSGLLS